MSPRARHADRETTDPVGFPPVADAAVPHPRRPDHSGGWVGRPAATDPSGRAARSGRAAPPGWADAPDQDGSSPRADPSDWPGPDDGYPPDERTWLEPDPAAPGWNRAEHSSGRLPPGDRRRTPPDDGWDAPAPEVAGRWTSIAARRRAIAARNPRVPPGRAAPRAPEADGWGPSGPDGAGPEDRVPRNAARPGGPGPPQAGRVPRNAPSPGEADAEWDRRVPRNAASAPGDADAPWEHRVPRNAAPAPGDTDEPWDDRVPRNAPGPAGNRDGRRPQAFPAVGDLPAPRDGRVPRNAPTPDDAGELWDACVPRNAPGRGSGAGPRGGRRPHAFPAPGDDPEPHDDGVPRNAVGETAEPWDAPVRWNAPSPGEADDPWDGRVPRNAPVSDDAAEARPRSVPRNPGDAAAPTATAEPWERSGPWAPADPWDPAPPYGRADARTWTGEHEAVAPAPQHPGPDADSAHGPGGAVPPDGPHGGLRLRSVLIPVVVGSLVAVALGVLARRHEGTGVAVNLAGFSSGGAAKAWLGSLALLLAIVQGVTGRMLHRGSADPMTPVVHRWSGRVAVLVTVPVAVQCLYAFGWSGATTSALVHSALGCVFYGAFVTKMLLLRRPGVPGWALAVAGGLLLAILAGVWLTSALWFFTGNGLTF